jgi:uroporphyrin-III C-methyltransferase
MRTGKVYLVGAGPGAPDLLTLRAAALLKQADIVFYDALVNADIIALAAHAERVAVGKRCGRHSTAQRFINKRLIDAARKHTHVVRLKGGDPMLFGRAQEEIAALKAAGIQFEVVPGVTSALAASAEIGVSLTQRGLARSVTFVTPRVGEGEQPNDWARAVISADTAVVYMGVGQAAHIAATLIELGMPLSKPVVVVGNASLAGRRELKLSLGDLHRIGELALDGPAVIFIGDVYSEASGHATESLPQARYA